MRRIGLSAGLLLAVLLWVLPAAATITVSGWSPLYRGIDFATGTADASETRIQKVFTMRVDLTDPTIEFYSTPPTPNGTNETIGQVTTDFVKSHGLAIGINANFFAPVVQQANYPRSLSGLAISQGVLVSSFQSSYPSVLITLGNQVSFATSNPSNLGNVWTSVSGSDMVLLNGVPQLQSCTTDFCLENPRTAVGLSHDGHYFYLMVIDGRQPSWSMGATLYETGQWLARFGAWTGLNLDGGGSTAMAKGQNGTATLINKPSGGTQRYVGNNLGVFAEPLGGAVWNGGGADNYWENPANWNGYNLSPGVGADLHFAGTTRLSCSNNFTAGSNFGDITFDPGAGVFNLAGNTITLNGSITNQSVNGQAITLPLILSGNTAFAPVAGNLTFGGQISSTGGVALAGSGAVTLNAAASFRSAVIVDGGVLRANSLLYVTGTNLIAGLSASGTINVGSGADLEIQGYLGGLNPLGKAVMNLSGGTVHVLSSTPSFNFTVASRGYGALNVTGGTLSTHQLYAQSAAGGVGMIGLAGGAVSLDQDLVINANAGTGVLTLRGGTLNHVNATRPISLDDTGDGRGEINLLGGMLNNQGCALSYGYNVSSPGGAGVGIVNLNAGTLILNRFVNTNHNGAGISGLSFLNFNGGTLTASANFGSGQPALSLSADFLPPLSGVYVNGPFGGFDGGAIIDTAGQNCVIDSPLLAPSGGGVSSLAVADGGAGYLAEPYVSILGDGVGASAVANMISDGQGGLKVGSITVCNPGVGYTTGAAHFIFVGGSPKTTATPGAVSTAPNTSGGLAKKGAGTLTLAAANTFKGPTEIDSGSLLVNGSLDPASVVTVESGAALGGTGTIGGPVVVESGGTLAPGGFITISNSLTLSPGSTTFMRINASTGGSDSAKQISTLNYAGTLVVSNIDGTVVPGLSFQLFSANARTGDFQQIQSAVPDVRWSFDAISGRLTALPSIATYRTNLLFTVTGQTLTLTWPGSHQGWIVQSNSVGLANLSGWQDIPGSESATHLSITITPAASNVFYRLRSP